jgi:hypothetical protein
VAARDGDNQTLDNHESVRGVQYLSIRYTERLAEEAAVTSVGSRGDSYDNALAESVNGLYKSELIYNEHEGPWKTVEDVELATLGWVHWWNTQRLLEPIGYVPPVESSRSGGTRSRAGRSVPLRAPRSRPVAPTTGELRRSTSSSASVHNGEVSIKPGAIHAIGQGWTRHGVRDIDYLMWCCKSKHRKHPVDGLDC